MDSFNSRTTDFIAAMVRACRGDLQARQGVSVLLGQLMQDQATVPLAESLMQVIVGERDRVQLTAPLDGEPRLVVDKILDELGSI